jgi:hypothetical protein
VAGLIKKGIEGHSIPLGMKRKIETAMDKVDEEKMQQ